MRGNSGILVSAVAALLLLAPTPAGLASDARITVDLLAANRPVNRLVLGSNTPWFDRGDALLIPGGIRFDQHRLAAVRSLAPTSLRYPGGTHADLYRWRHGIGPYAARGFGTHAFSKAQQRVAFGTDEFLLLCAQLGAEPVITVNMVTGDAEEAADWLDYVNTGRRRRLGGTLLPRVRYWELGNEPYLIDEGLKILALKPEDYATRASGFMSALRARDPSAKIGIALRSDTIGGVPATPYPGFNAIVLGRLQEPPDFASVHNAYAPYVPDEILPEERLYLALMAAPVQVAEDLDASTAALRKRWPERDIRLAVTEYSAFFNTSPPTDRLVISLGAALYVADLLRVFAERDDILMAHHWSLSGNWMFGAIGLSGELRPVFETLSAYSRSMRGELQAVSIEGPMLRTEQAGMVGARKIAAITTLALRRNEELILFVLNKSPTNQFATEIRTEGSAVRQVRSAKRLTGDGPFSAEVAWSDSRVQLQDGVARLVLPSHSLTVLILESGATTERKSLAR